MAALIFKPIIVCIISAILILLMKNTLPQLVPLIAITAGILVFLILIPQIKTVLYAINSISEDIPNLSNAFSITVKIVLIALICEFGAGICIDAGESYLASKISFTGKILIIAISIPSIVALIKLITGMINEI